jgi:hypothetical protein
MYFFVTLTVSAPIERRPVIDEILLSPYSDPTGEYYRARIIAMNEDDDVVLAYFIDLGDEITVSSTNMYDPTPEMMQVRNPERSL